MLPSVDITHVSTPAVAYCWSFLESGYKQIIDIVQCWSVLESGYQQKLQTLCNKGIKSFSLTYKVFLI